MWVGLWKSIPFSFPSPILQESFSGEKQIIDSYLDFFYNHANKTILKDAADYLERRISGNWSPHTVFPCKLYPGKNVIYSQWTFYHVYFIFSPIIIRLNKCSWYFFHSCWSREMKLENGEWFLPSRHYSVLRSANSRPCQPGILLFFHRVNPI